MARESYEVLNVLARHADPAPAPILYKWIEDALAATERERPLAPAAPSAPNPGGTT